LEHPDQLWQTSVLDATAAESTRLLLHQCQASWKTRVSIDALVESGTIQAREIDHFLHIAGIQTLTVVGKSTQ
jgi:hypothetical protein